MGVHFSTTGLDRDVYVHRSVHDELVDAVARGRNALVIGERGSGKTTLLNMVAGDLQQRGMPVGVVTGRLALTPVDFARLVVCETLTRGATLGHVGGVARPVSSSMQCFRGWCHAALGRPTRSRARTPRPGGTSGQTSCSQKRGGNGVGGTGTLLSTGWRKPKCLGHVNGQCKG